MLAVEPAALPGEQPDVALTALVVLSSSFLGAAGVDLLHTMLPERQPHPWTPCSLLGSRIDPRQPGWHSQWSPTLRHPASLSLHPPAPCRYVDMKMGYSLLEKWFNAVSCWLLDELRRTLLLRRCPRVNTASGSAALAHACCPAQCACLHCIT